MPKLPYDSGVKRVELTNKPVYTVAKEVITVSSTVLSLNKAIFQDADTAYITFETADTRVFYDGSVPTATSGHIFPTGSTLTLKSPLDIANFQAIKAGATDSKITVTYSRNLEKSSDDYVSKFISVASRNAPLNQLLSNGTDTNMTYKIKHVATTDIAFPRLAYGNWYLNNGEANGLNDITVKSAIEYNGTIYPARYSGADTTVITPGATVFSDQVNIVIPKGAVFHTRTNVVVTAGQKWPLSLTSYPADTEGKTTGDVAYSGVTTNTFEYCYSPCAIVGQPSSNDESAVLFIGDSIMSGQGDSPNDNGFLIRVFNNAKGYIRVSKPSARTSDFLSSVRKNRMLLSNYCSYAVCQLGVNDVIIGNVKLEVVKANLMDIWNALAIRGIKVYQTTITPVSTSTDTWATTQNQTTHANNSVRTALNDWIRTTPAPLSGYFEVANTVETSQNSGIWKPSLTSDGTHPNVTGHIAMTAAIGVSVFD